MPNFMKMVIKMEKEVFEQKLEEIKDYKEVVKLYRDLNFKYKKKKISDQDLQYIEQQIREKFFCDEKFSKYSTKVILKQVAAYVKEIEDFDEKNLNLIELGESMDDEKVMQDILCMYKEKFISIFGIEKDNFLSSKRYDMKKYMQPNFFEAIKAKSNKDSAKVQQYGKYFVLMEEEKLSIYKEKVVTALVSLEQTAFDKMKFKLMNFFNKNIFAKNKYLPMVEEVFNSNKLRNYVEEGKSSKVKAKNRMKNVLLGDRIRTRVVDSKN